MSGLAHYFEAEGFATVLVGFVREHIELIKPPRALWLNFPMGRPMGKPNDPDYQLKVIRAAFGLFDAVLIKDNHIAAAGGLGNAVKRARAEAGHMV